MPETKYESPRMSDLVNTLLKRLDDRFLQAVSRELSDWRLWFDRFVVVAAAVTAGLTVVGFTWLTEHALTAFFKLGNLTWWAPLIWTPTCTAVIVWLTRRYAPGAAGSGIPQVIAALDVSVKPQDHGLFVSLKLSLAKIALTTWGMLAGLSLGREGPSVQIAAGIMLTARRWLPKRSTVTVHGLLVAGGAAGIAAAFNTPLAGVMFAIEELSRSPEQRNSGLIMAAIVLAGVVAISINGNETYFGMIHVSKLGASILLPGLLVAVCSGIAGGLFARLLLGSLNNTGKGFASRIKQTRPIQFAWICGMAIAVIGIVTQGMTFGSGYGHTRDMLSGTTDTPLVYVLFKFIATWLTAWSGVPAGIFAPSLAIGAALGNDVTVLLHIPHATTLIALGMVGFLAAVTQAPLTSFIIVMEMVDGHAMVLSLMACALVASAVSRMISKPLYSSLTDLQLQRIPSNPEVGQSKGAGTPP